MKRDKSDAVVQVESYRGHSICLNKATTKFVVTELAEVEPVDSVQAAKNAIDRHIAGLNKGVRRKVLTFGSKWYGDDEGRTIRYGELTSWTRSRGYGNRLEGIVSYGGTDRDSLSPNQIFEDTPENRALMEKVRHFDKAARDAKKQAEEVIEKEIQKAVVPAHFLKDENPL